MILISLPQGVGEIKRTGKIGRLWQKNHIDHIRDQMNRRRWSNKPNMGQEVGKDLIEKCARCDEIYSIGHGDNITWIGGSVHIRYWSASVQNVSGKLQLEIVRERHYGIQRC